VLFIFYLVSLYLFCYSFIFEGGILFQGKYSREVVGQIKPVIIERLIQRSLFVWSASLIPARKRIQIANGLRGVWMRMV